MIPGTYQQLVIALLFVLPGFVYQALRSRLRGPAPDDSNATNRVLRALGVSAGLASVYAAVVGPYLAGLAETRPAHPGGAAGLLAHVRQVGLLSLLLVFVVPAALAGADYWRLRKGLSLRLAYDPTPRAWDYAFREIEPTYVRVLTTDGTWIGGWFGENSFVSSYPEPREMFIQTAHLMDADGSFGAEQVGTNGMYVRCDDIRAVEFVDGRPVGDDNDVTGTPGAGTDE